MNMRKGLPWLLIAALLLTGCGQGSAVVRGTDPAQSASSTTEPDYTQSPVETGPPATEPVVEAPSDRLHYVLEQVILRGQTMPGQQCYLVLVEDGSGWINTLGEERSLLWTEDEMIINGETAGYHAGEDLLTVQAGEMEMIFRLSQDPAPDRTYMAADLRDQEATQWYGWWVMYNCQGDWWDYEYNWWDCGAELTGSWDDEVTMTIWDENGSRQDPLGQIPLYLYEGETDLVTNGSGMFMWEDLLPGQWTVEYDGNSLYIYGTLEDCFDYYIYLRPWGLIWSDVEAEYPNDLPCFYYDWYLPMIEAGLPLPDVLHWDLGNMGQEPPLTLDPEGMVAFDYDETLFSFNQEWRYFKHVADGSTVTVRFYTDHEVLSQFFGSRENLVLLQAHKAVRIESVDDRGFFRATYYVTFDEPIGPYVGCSVDLRTISKVTPRWSMNKLEEMIATLRSVEGD